MITLDEFIIKYKDKQVEVTGSSNAKYQCVDLANAYIKEVLGLPIIEWTNAQDFPKKCLPSNYEYIKNTENNYPSKGDIVIWSSLDNIGHIAICIEDGSITKFKSFDQNWSKPLYCTIETHIYTGSNHKVIGFLRPKSIINDMTDEQKKVLELLENYKITAGHGNLEGAMNTLIGNVTELRNATESIENFKKDIETLKANIKSLNSKYSELEAKFIENQKINEKQQKALVTANDKILELDKTIENITADKNSWQLRYNNKNDDFNNLSKLFEEYKKCNPQTETKTTLIKNIINFIKSLFKK